MGTTPNLWQNDWWQPACRASSPNFCTHEARERISLAALHNISLPPFKCGTGAAEELPTNSIDEAEHPLYSIVKDLHVSSHFFIAHTDGTVQFVPYNDTAYHADMSSFDGKGECSGFPVGIETGGCDFGPSTEVRYAALLPLLSALMEQYPIEAAVGHQSVAPDRRTDPGHFFDWPWPGTAGFPVYR